MKKFLLGLMVFPGFVFASVGDDMNVLLRHFFGGEEVVSLDAPLVESFAEEESFSEDAGFSAEVIEVPVFEVEEYLSLDKLGELKKQVFLEEDDLAFTELEIEGTLQALDQAFQQKQQLAGDISLLDRQLGKVGRRLDDLLKQSQQWRSELVALTQRKSDLLALLRVWKRMYEQFLQKNYLREEVFSDDDGGGLLRWLLADSTVSQLLEERRRQKKFALENKRQLDSFRKLKEEILNNEKYRAVVYGRIESLLHQVAQEKKTLSDEVHENVENVSQLRLQEENMQQELRNLRRRQAGSTVLLQQLRQVVGEVAERLETDLVIEEEPLFDWPLRLDALQVTAGFHDEAYQQEMKAVHNGVDFYAPFGTNVYAPADGQVKKVGHNGYGYSYLVMDHADGFLTLYGHLSDIYMNEDMLVEQGELIAKTGGAGGGHGTGPFSTGKHLHFEMMREERFVDPLRFLPLLKNENNVHEDFIK